MLQIDETRRIRDTGAKTDIVIESASPVIPSEVKPPPGDPLSLMGLPYVS